MTELSPEAKALLRRARSEFSPDENRLARVRSALATQIAVSPAELGASKTAPHSTGAPAANVTTWTVAHSIGTAVLIGALGAAGLATWRTRASSVAPNDRRAVALETVGPPISKTALSPPSPRKPAHGSQSADEGTPVPVETAVPSAVPFADKSGDQRTPRPEAAGDAWGSALTAPTALARTQRRPRAKTDLLPETPADPLGITPPAPVAASPITTPPVSPFTTAPPPAAEVADSLAEEVRLLRDARAALDRGDPSRALVSLDAHASRFLHGTLYEERLATRVLALCAMGRIEAARVAAEELERAAPRSPHLGRVRASCIGATASP